VIKSFRSIVLVDDKQFNKLVKEAAYVNPIGEVVAIGIGVAFGLWMSVYWVQDIHDFWLRLYIPLALSAMFGLLGWIIYGSIAATRLIAELHRQPLQIDQFDTTPFTPIGHHSLVMAIVFLGGIMLSITFGMDIENISSWQS
jgi:hypothetical protein